MDVAIYLDDLGSDSRYLLLCSIPQRFLVPKRSGHPCGPLARRVRRTWSRHMDHLESEWRKEDTDPLAIARFQAAKSIGSNEII